MKKRAYCIIAIIPLLVILLNFSAWAVPNLINYQGKLTDSEGTALNGDYTIIFYIYNDETNGTALWGPENKTVSVSEGIFNVQLGGVPFPSNLFDNDVLYLEIRIYNADTLLEEILEPRQRLTSTAFAMKAGDADTVDGVQAADLEESSEIDSKIADHASIADAHHTKTTSFTDLTDAASDDQIPDDITVESAEKAGSADTAGDADTVDGKHADEFGDGHSLDAADGNPVNAVYVDNNGNVGFGTTNPTRRLHIHMGNASNYIRLSNTTTGQGEQDGLYMGMNVEGTVFLINKEETSMAFQTASKTRLVITKDGNVGIGTGTPEGDLHISDIGDDDMVSLYIGGSPKDIATHASQHLQIGHWDPDNEIWTERMRITPEGKVGIGTTEPTAKVHSDSGRSHIVNFLSVGGIGDFAVSAGSSMQIGHWDGDTGTFEERIRISDSGKVGIGTITPKNALDVKGTIRAEELIVETGWADFVFKDDYELMSLNTLEDYIAQNGHLPDILTAKDVEENGIGLGQMQTKLLQKIEELTLYLIEQNKKIIELEQQVAQFKKALKQ